MTTEPTPRVAAAAAAHEPDLRIYGPTHYVRCSCGHWDMADTAIVGLLAEFALYYLAALDAYDAEHKVIPSWMEPVHSLVCSAAGFTDEGRCPIGCDDPRFGGRLFRVRAETGAEQ